MQSISNFNFNTSTIRVVIIDGNPWFVAKDVCDILGYTQASRSTVMSKLDSSEQTLKRIQKGLRSVSIVSVRAH